MLLHLPVSFQTVTGNFDAFRYVCFTPIKLILRARTHHRHSFGSVVTCSAFVLSVYCGPTIHCSVANQYDPLIRSAIVVGFAAAYYESSHCQSSIGFVSQTFLRSTYMCMCSWH
jgi:hypothetical protein